MPEPLTFDWQDDFVLRFRDPAFKDAFPVLDKLRHEMRKTASSYAQRWSGEEDLTGAAFAEHALMVFACITPSVMTDLTNLMLAHTDYAYKESLNFEAIDPDRVFKTPVDAYTVLGRFAAWALWGENPSVVFELVQGLVEWQRVYA